MKQFHCLWLLLACTTAFTNPLRTLSDISLNPLQKRFVRTLYPRAGNSPPRGGRGGGGPSPHKSNILPHQGQPVRQQATGSTGGSPSTTRPSHPQLGQQSQAGRQQGAAIGRSASPQTQGERGATAQQQVRGGSASPPSTSQRRPLAKLPSFRDTAKGIRKGDPITPGERASEAAYFASFNARMSRPDAPIPARGVGHLAPILPTLLGHPNLSASQLTHTSAGQVSLAAYRAQRMQRPQEPQSSLPALPSLEHMAQGPGERSRAAAQPADSFSFASTAAANPRRGREGPPSSSQDSDVSQDRTKRRKTG